jgi:hypothetical protein
MMKPFNILLATAVLAFVSGCGGADAQPEAPPSTNNTPGIRIQKQAGPNDAYDGGINLFRDAHYLAGGTPGHVNTGLYARTRTGKGQTAFEWTGLFLMDNYADAGENVALYAQANGFGKGANWGFVSECTNAYSPRSTCVGAEINVSTTGEDTGTRIGIDVVLADGPLWRGMAASSVIEGTAGLRIGSSWPSSPHAKWTTGVDLTGRMGTGIDLSKATTQTAIKLKPGQQIDMGDGVRIDLSGGQIRFLNGEQVVHSFPMN